MATIAVIVAVYPDASTVWFFLLSLFSLFFYEQPPLKTKPREKSKDESNSLSLNRFCTLKTKAQWKSAPTTQHCVSSCHCTVILPSSSNARYRFSLHATTHSHTHKAKSLPRPLSLQTQSSCSLICEHKDKHLSFSLMGMIRVRCLLLHRPHSRDINAMSTYRGWWCSWYEEWLG